ncbi:MAG: hypothetical protein P1V97_20340 [Planctomycetota bacterium]|nr:hypothetical protein [Planctomycetota bacterium]
MPTRIFCLIALSSLLLGCSAIPSAEISDKDFEIQRSRQSAPLPIKLAIAPVKISVTGQGMEGFDKAGAIKTSLLERQLDEKIQQAKIVTSQSLLSSKDDTSLDQLFWESGADLILEIEITGLETRFDSHNGFWIPNMLIWGYSMVPAWFIPTDRYELELQGTYKVRLIDNPQALVEESVTVSTIGTFDELDKGWRWFGLGAVVGSSLNNKGNWERITGKLFPSAASLLAQKISCRVEESLKSATSDKNYANDARRSLAIVVGIGEYQQSEKWPAKQALSAGAKALAKSLSLKFGPRYVKSIFDGEATLERIDTLLKEHFSRAREGDDVYLYFAGRTSGQSLIFHNAGERGGGRLSMAALAKRIKDFPGRKKVLLDVGFPDVEISSRLFFNPLLRQSISVFAGQRTGQYLTVPSGYGRGLFTHHLIAAVDGKGDLNKDNYVSLKEMVSYVTLRVESASGFNKSTKQSPSAFLVESDLAVSGSSKAP